MKLNNIAFNLITKGVRKLPPAAPTALPLNVDQATATGITENVSTQGTDYPYELTFKDDGTKMYVSGIASNQIIEYDLANAWDLSSATYLQKISTPFEPLGMWWYNGGQNLIMLNYNNDKLVRYDLSTAWDISTAVLSATEYSIGAYGAYPYDFTFNNDGTLLLTADRGGAISQHFLSTAYDISTAVFDRTLSTFGSFTYSLYLYNNEKLLVLNSSTGVIKQWSFNGSLELATDDNQSLTTGLSSLTGVYVNPEGSMMYVTGYGDRLVTEYSLT